MTKNDDVRASFSVLKKSDVVFWDDCCPSPYSDDTLKKKGLGGSEATLTRVAEALSSHMSVIVKQHNRKEEYTSQNGVIYTGRTPPEPKVVIVMRTIWSAVSARKAYPSAKLILWCHDWASLDTARGFDELVKIKATIVCVSNTHKAQMQITLAPHGDLCKLPIKYIYNPVDVSSVGTSESIDKDKYVFFSSPHKGLKETLKVFERLTSFQPSAKLYISNPGYYESAKDSYPWLVNLGVLPHSEVLKHVAESQCVFYPNYTFSETFGLVMAEANAVGTPVLSHYFGAAPEILDKRQLIDGRNNKEIIDKALYWQKERPVVTIKEAFKIESVIREWINLVKQLR